MQRWLPSVLAVVAAASVTTALSVEPAGASRSKGNVVAAVYPLAFAAKSGGGTRVGVTNLTPSGAEPPDLELNSDPLDPPPRPQGAVLPRGGLPPPGAEA